MVRVSSPPFLRSAACSCGPFDSFDQPETYLAALEKLQPVIDRIDVKKSFAQGNEICVIYDIVTKTDVGTSTIAEWFQVINERITALQAVFDARPWASLFRRWARVPRRFGLTPPGHLRRFAATIEGRER